jgi:hypothetical protein
VRQDGEAVTLVEHSPGPDVRLIRNIWSRKGVLERVRGAKFMWGLFACNELLHRRFGRLGSPSCSCCSDADEPPWHVIGECNGVGAVAARTGWADRMGGGGGGCSGRRIPRCKKGRRRFVWT